MKRVVIVGTTGSGKTTLGEVLSEQLGTPFIDLDALHWEPDWQEASLDVFRQRVDLATRPDRWILAGNYSKVRDMVWQRADTLIWLDYPLWLILVRLFRRTVKRIITQENLWGTGNRESWRKQFFSRDSLFIWALKTYARRKREYPQLIKQNTHLKLIHLRSVGQTDTWLSGIKDAIDE